MGHCRSGGLIVTYCEYCCETVHHELDRVVDKDDMCYHVWCYERIQEGGLEPPKES